MTAALYVLALGVTLLLGVVVWQERRFWRMFNKWAAAHRASVQCHATSPAGERCAMVAGHDGFHHGVTHPMQQGGGTYTNTWAC